MIIYQNTFENIMTRNHNFPVEDQFYACDNLAVVADGITRDPIGTLDLSSLNVTEMIERYPRPSGAELAAKEIVNSFKVFKGDLVKQLIEANKRVKKLNEKHIKRCDYLENDYYGAVASCVYIDKNVLNWAYICDCGVIIYDKDGKIKFKTQDDKEIISDPYIDKIGVSWNNPETRVIVRRDYRNNLNNIQDGICVSYGAITGEENAKAFIRNGSLLIDDEDVVVVYTDGITNFLYEEEFINIITNFNSLKFEKYIENKSKENYDKFGKEKTIIIMKKSCYF